MTIHDLTLRGPTLHSKYVALTNVPALEHKYAEHVAREKGYTVVTHVVYGKKDRVLKYYAPTYRVVSTDRRIKQGDIVLYQKKDVYYQDTLVIVEIKERLTEENLKLGAYLLSIHRCGHLIRHYVDYRPISEEYYRTLKGILTGESLEKIPLLLNDPFYKPFCMDVLSRGTSHKTTN